MGYLVFLKHTIKNFHLCLRFATSELELEPLLTKFFSNKISCSFFCMAYCLVLLLCQLITYQRYYLVM